MSMQMDACFEKERIGTLFVWVAAPKGGLRWGGGREDSKYINFIGSCTCRPKFMLRAAF